VARNPDACRATRQAGAYSHEGHIAIGGYGAYRTRKLLIGDLISIRLEYNPEKGVKQVRRGAPAPRLRTA